MDEKIKNVITKLQENGFDDKKLMMYLSLVYQDFIADMQEDMLEIDDAQLSDLEATMKTVTIGELTDSNAQQPFRKLLNKMYGMSGEMKFKQYLLDELESTLKDVVELKDKLSKLDMNDPKVQDMIAKAKSDPNFSDFETAVKELSE